MKFLDIIKLRKSVRAYSDKKISKKDLDLILEAGRLAPSAKNLQEWKFLVLRNKETLLKLVPICKEQKFVAEANIVIVAYSDYADYTMTCGQKAYTVDISIAVTQMILQATELGIGSCWLGAFYENEVKSLLNLKKQDRVVAMFTLGYPKNKSLKELSCKPRKSIEEIVRFD